MPLRALGITQAGIGETELVVGFRRVGLQGDGLLEVISGLGEPILARPVSRPLRTTSLGFTAPDTPTVAFRSRPRSPR